jgi:hypothetical protein
MDKPTLRLMIHDKVADGRLPHHKLSHTMCRSAARRMLRRLTDVPSAANRPRPTHQGPLPPGGASGPGGGAVPAGSAPRGGLHPAGARLSPPASRLGLERTRGSALDGGPQKGWLHSHRSYIARRSKPTAAIRRG